MGDALDGAVVVTEVMLALGVRGHRPVVNHANGPRLFRLGSLMLAEFGLAEEETDEMSAPQ